ncbi:hypothetical protein [Moorena producens]|nr:hypothetical protein [Moorena producens]
MTNSIGERISYQIIKYEHFSLFPIPDSRFPTLTGKFLTWCQI